MKKLTQARWNKMNGQERYELLVSIYGVTGDTISKFGLQKWNQLTVPMRAFLQRYTSDANYRAAVQQ